MGSFSMDQLSAKQNLVGLYVSQARTAEENGRFYMPLGKLSRFNQKIKNFGTPDLKIIESQNDYETLATSSYATTEIDNPMARRIVIDRSTNLHKRAIQGFKYWPKTPYRNATPVCKKSLGNFEHSRY